jgi:phospho-N-acetylmuramoyl-pentapeptide-transferase
MISLVLAAIVALLASIGLTKLLIDLLDRRRHHQPINPDLPHHAGRAQTPTMGGLAIIASALMAIPISQISVSGTLGSRALVVCFAIVATGAVGLADDVTKLRMDRNGGLTRIQKMVGVVVAGTAVGLATVAVGGAPPLLVPFVSSTITLESVPTVVLAIVLVAATTNAVNLTDGLDGLAGGASVLSFGALALAGYWIFRHPEYDVDGALGVAVLCAAIAAACIGFLWWNTSPASIFMGDVGALALGGALAAAALQLGLVLLLPLIGGLFVIEALSVIVLGIAFKRFGRRPFHAPIHHEFEDRKNPRKEPTVVMRLWIFHAVCVAMSLAILYGDWLQQDV